MTRLPFKNSALSIKSDLAENSIMQTITIAVSAILVASGLITAPGLINNARDNNARGDLANIAYAQEVLMADDGSYSDKVNKEDADVDGWYLGSQSHVRYALSDDVESSALVCNDPDWAYLLKAKSQSGETFFRSSGGSITSPDIGSLVIPSCIATHPDFTDFGASELNDLSTPVFTASALNVAVFRVEQNQKIDVISPASDPVALAVVEGALPTGLTLKEEHIIGTPTKTGDFDFTIEATNSAGSASKSFSLKVSLAKNEGWSADSIALNNTPLNWNSLASSSDGQRLYASATNGATKYSTDGGMTWMNTSLPIGNWEIAMSSGTNRSIAYRSGMVSQPYITTNGVTFSSSYVGDTGVHRAPAIDNAGNMFTAQTTTVASRTNSGSFFAVSNNNWQTTFNNLVDQHVVSSDGWGSGSSSFVVLGYDRGLVQIASPSVYAPVSPKALTTSGALTSNVKTYVSIKDDGSEVLVATSQGNIYSSVNKGASYQLLASNTGVWTDIELLSNGDFIGLKDGKVYRSVDRGVTWNDDSPNPALTFSSLDGSGSTYSVLGADAAAKYIFVNNG